MFYVGCGLGFCRVVLFALFRGMVDESGNQFVAYFLPTAETRGKRKRDGEIGVDYEPEDE